VESLLESTGFWNQESKITQFSCISLYINDPTICKTLFGKQESLESNQESMNQAKIPTINHVDKNH